MGLLLGPATTFVMTEQSLILFCKNWIQIFVEHGRQEISPINSSHFVALPGPTFTHNKPISIFGFNRKIFYNR